MFRTCPWSYGSQNSTSATQSNCTCPVNHKERDKQKKFLLTGKCGVILLKTIFWLDCADVFRSQDLLCSDINHVVIKRTICACRFGLYAFRIYIFFPQHFRTSRHGYSCACPDKAAQIYFSRVSPKPVFGMIEFPANCTNYDQTSNMSRLVCIFPLWRVSPRRNLITTAISATETKW